MFDAYFVITVLFFDTVCGRLRVSYAISRRRLAFVT